MGDPLPPIVGVNSSNRRHIPTERRDAWLSGDFRRCHTDSRASSRPCGTGQSLQHEATASAGGVWKADEHLESGRMRYWDSALPNQGSLLDTWLLPELDTAEHVALRTGFLSVPGARSVASRLRACLARGGHIVVVAGGNDLQVDPLAVEILHRVLGTQDRAEFYLLGDATFTNAKTYYARQPDGHVAAYVGSANLTAGMMTNIEAGVTLSSRDSEAERLLCEQVLAGITQCSRSEDATPVTKQGVDRRYLLSTAVRRSRTGRGHTRELADLLTPAIDLMDRIASRGPVLPTGLSELDGVLGGLAPGTLTVLGGETGAGKTAIVLTIAGFLARQGHRTLIYDNADRDGEHTDVVMRLAAATGRIRHLDMRTGRMTDAEWMTLAHTFGGMADWPVRINGRPGLAVEDLVAETHDLPDDQLPDVVFVDGIAGMTCAATTDNREREVAEIALALKSLAYDLGVPIVVTSQLNRGALQRADNRPRLEDLRDSSALGHLADTVLLVHRPDYWEPHDPRFGEIDIICAKNPNGPPFTATFAHQLHLSRVSNIFRPTELDDEEQPGGNDHGSGSVATDVSESNATASEPDESNRSTA